MIRLSGFYALIPLALSLAACTPQAINPAYTSNRDVNLLLDSAGNTAAIIFKLSTAPSLFGNADSILPVQPIFEAVDSAGHRISNYVRFVEIHAYSDSTCSTEVPSSIQNNSLTMTSGQAIFTNLQILKSNVVAIRLEEGTTRSNCISGLSVAPGVLASLEFASEPGPISESADLAFTSQPVVRAYDANRNLITYDSSSVVSLVANDGNACTGTDLTSALGGGVSQSLSSGTASFTNVQALKMATKSLRAKLGAFSACSQNLVVIPGAPAAMTKTAGNAQTGIVGAALGTGLQVKVEDAHGNPITSAQVDWTVSAGGGTLSAASSNSAANGLATNAWTLGSTAGSNSLTALVHGTLISTSFTATATAGSASKLVFSTAPSATAVAGALLAAQPAVTISDASGNPISSGTDSITLETYSNSTCTTAASTTPNAGSSLSGTATMAASSGVATYSGLKVNLAGTVYLKASASGLTSTCSSAIAVSPAAFSLSQSNFTASSTLVSGASLTATLTAKDAFGNGAPSGITAVGFSSTTVGGTGSFGSTTDAGSGVYTVDFTGQTAGSVTLYASLNASNISVHPSVTITAGSLNKIIFSVAPSTSGDTDNVLSTQPSIQGADASNNPVSTYTGAVTLSAYSDTACSTSVSGGLTATTNPVSASSGTAAFSGLQIVSTSVKSIKASDGTRSACFATLTIAPGALNSLIYSTQPAPLTPSADTAFTTQPVIQILDAHSNLITSNSSSSVALTANDASDCSGGTVASGLGGTTTKTFSSGVATFTNVKASSTLAKSILATVGAKTVCSSAFTVSVGAASAITITGGNSQNGAVSTALATAFSVTVKDSGGNLVSGTTINWAVTAGGGTLTSATSVTNSSGVATNSYTLGSSTGSNTVTATISSTSTSQTFTATAIGNATKLVFTTQPSTSGSVASNLARQPVVAIQDSSNVTIAGATNSVSLSLYSDSACIYLVPTTKGGTNSLAGTLTLAGVNGVASFTDVAIRNSGANYLKATSGSLTSACSSLSTLTAGSAAKIQFGGGPVLTKGVCSYLKVWLYDTYGNQPSSGNAQVTLTSTGSSSFYLDQNCQNIESMPVSETNSNYGEAGYIKENSVTTFTLTATAPGYSTVTQTLSVRDPAANLVLFQPDENTSVNLNSGLAAPSALWADGTHLYSGESFYYAGNRVSIWAASASTPPATFAPKALVLGSENPNKINIRSQTYLSGNLYHSIHGLLTVGTKLFMAESSNRIVVWNTLPTSNNATPDFALGVTGLTATSSNSPSASNLSNPTQMASDGTHFVVADTDYCRILIWNSIPTTNGQAADLVLGNSGFGSYSCTTGSQGLDTPSGVAIYGTKLIVSDTYNNRVLVWNTFPTVNDQAADVVIGQADFSANTSNGYFTQSNLTKPGSLYVSPSGKLFVADKNRVMIWNTIPTTNGANADYVLGQATFTDYINPNFSTNFGGTLNIAGDGTNLYISASRQNRILVYTSPITTNNQVADRVLGQANLTSISPNSPGLPTASNIQLLETTDHSPVYPQVLPGVCTDGTRLYVADRGRNRVLVYNSFPTIQNQAADFVLGQSNFSTAAPGTSQQGLDTPAGVDCDANYLAVSDQGNHRVMIWNLPIIANNQAADRLVGQPSFSSNSYASYSTTRSTIGRPNGVSIQHGKLLVTDTDSNRILVWDSIPSTLGQNPDRVLLQPDFTSSAVTYGSLSSMSNPYQVQYDGTHLIADGIDTHPYVWNTFPSANQTCDYQFGSSQISSLASFYSNGTSIYAANANHYNTDFYSVLVWDTFPDSISYYSQRFFGVTSDFSSNNETTLGFTGLSGHISLSGSGTKLIGLDPIHNRLMIWNNLP